MNEKVIKTLEFNKIIDELTDMAGSEPGRELCRKLQPMNDPERIERAQEETALAFTRIVERGAPSFSGNRDIGAQIARLKVGASLSSTELLQITGVLECTKRLLSYNKSVRAAADVPKETADLIDGYISGLDDLRPLCDEIRRCIIEEDVIADDASPGLHRIRREQATVNGRIHSQLTSMLNGSLRTYLQDGVITMRGDRYCVPVKAEYKSQVPGMIHDQSSTGSTFFIEPQAVVNLNNRLRELKAEEKNEIANILADLSQKAQEHTAELHNDAKYLKILDHIFARGRLALKHNGVRPLYNNDRRINIRRGRHPLIDPKAVVPVDIRLGDDFDLLIITGPNTGGKTVALKTLGLFVLMGQAGLHIPAGDRSELSVFNQVYADIGDEQSIEQNLSTFSSHMTNTVSILERADYKSLCLFDEPGAGTDPTEGAALAMAILDSLHQKGIRTMATTHYSEIKIYALQTKGVENACCEFDVHSLKPTYRLLIGIPGKSNAFAISRRLGLSETIIESAKSRISEENESFEELLSRLESDRLTMEEDRLQIESYKREIESLKEKTRQQRERTEASRDKIIKKANEEAAAILKEAKDLADETIRTFQKAGPGASMKDLEKARSKVRGELTEKQKGAAKADSLQSSNPRNKPADPAKLKKGDSVHVISMGIDGVVMDLPDRKGNVRVRCGIITSTVACSDLAVIPDAPSYDGFAGGGKRSPAPSGSKKSGGTSIGMSKSLSTGTEINLLGKTVDEALHELDKYLDDAYIAHIPMVRVVHGKGTGALRNAVHGMLRRMKNVENYRLGEFGEGDAGVTIVTFK